VSGVSLALGPGDGLLVTGAAGSGKTSLLRGLLGLAPRRGLAEVLGRPAGAPDALRRVGYAPARRPFPPGPSTLEVVALVAHLRGLPDPPVAALDAAERAGVAEPERAAAALDVEEARRAALACALAGDPQVLVLDDPWEFPETRAEIAAARARGAAVLATSREPGGLGALLGRSLRLVGGSPA
jgi:ABC-type multidrug transport system ATPase subunit